MRVASVLVLPTLLCLAVPRGARAVEPPDPHPYQLVVDRAEWDAPDGSRLAFCLLGRRDEACARVLAVYQRTRNGWTRLFLDRDRGTRPWAIDIAEFDGDSLPEVVVGVYKRSRFDPMLRNRLFVFDWTPNGALFPKWLGSRLGCAFVDFAVVTGPDGLDRLLTQERRTRDSANVRGYVWNGFGFDPEEQAGSRSCARGLLVRMEVAPAGPPRISLLPLGIAACRPRPAEPELAREIVAQLVARSDSVMFAEDRDGWWTLR